MTMVMSGRRHAELKARMRGLEAASLGVLPWLNSPRLVSMAVQPAERRVSWNEGILRLDKTEMRRANWVAGHYTSTNSTPSR